MLLELKFLFIIKFKKLGFSAPLKVGWYIHSFPVGRSALIWCENKLVSSFVVKMGKAINGIALTCDWLDW